MPQEASETPPLLVVDAVTPDGAIPTRLAAVVRVGGHPVRLVLDFAPENLGAAEYVQTPWLLALHEPSMRAVVSTVFAVHKGETVAFPRDLSADVRDSTPPPPWLPPDPAERARLDAAADLVEIGGDLRRVGDTEPPRIAGRLTVDGRVVDVDAEVHAEPGTMPIVRWRGATPPGELTPAQLFAIQRALADRARS